MTQISTSITLKSADGFEFPLYVAQPSGRPRGALVVLQEIFGVNSHIRSLADGFAADGYLALAPAAFQRSQPGVELGYQPEDIGAGRALKAAIEALPAPGVLADIEASIDYAHKALGGSSKVGVIGYCWGGLLAWRAACLLQGVACAVPYYGGGVTLSPEKDRKPHCPVLAHFGAKDPNIPIDGVKAFAQAQGGARVQVHVYEADHGFNCDQRGAYDAVSAKLARERTLAFFAAHLA